MRISEDFKGFLRIFANLLYGSDMVLRTSEGDLRICEDFKEFLNTDLRGFWLIGFGDVKIGKMGKMLIFNIEFSIFNEFWNPNDEFRMATEGAEDSEIWNHRETMKPEPPVGYNTGTNKRPRKKRGSARGGPQ